MRPEAGHTHGAAHVASPTEVAQAPPLTTFGATSDAAPALVEFHGKTFMAWSNSTNGALNLAVVVRGQNGYQLESQVTLSTYLSPGRSPALAVFNGRAYMAWTGTNGQLNVVSTADGVHIEKVTLPDTSRTGPTLAAFNGRLYLGWTGLDGRLNVESSANGMTFGNKVTLPETSYIVSGKQVVELSPALASFGGRLYIAWTGTNMHLNVESSANGMTFGNKVTLGDTSDAAPALAIETPAVKGQPTRLVLGWTGVGNLKLNTMTSTDGRTFGGKVTSGQTGFGGLALLSPSAGALDIAWTGVQTGPRHLNFMQV
jgi:hypothetical protein